MLQAVYRQERSDSAHRIPADPSQHRIFKARGQRFPWMAQGWPLTRQAVYRWSESNLRLLPWGRSHAPSSGSFMEVIASTFTTVTLTASTNPAPYGVPVVFTATVLDTAGTPPQEMSIFYVGANGELVAHKWIL